MYEYIKKIENICKAEFGDYDSFHIVYDGDYPYVVIKYCLNGERVKLCDYNPKAVQKIIDRIEAELPEYDVLTELDTDYSEIGVMPFNNFTWPECNYIETDSCWGEAEYESIAE